MKRTHSVWTSGRNLIFFPFSEYEERRRNSESEEYWISSSAFSFFFFGLSFLPLTLILFKSYYHAEMLHIISWCQMSELIIGPPIVSTLRMQFNTIQAVTEFWQITFRGEKERKKQTRVIHPIRTSQEKSKYTK